MTTKHTPGPWRVECDPCHYDSATDVVDTNGGPIARTGGRNVLTMEDNAHLIAAAPELLEALKMALEAHDYPGREGWTVNARAAIAKAEGRS